LNPLDIIIYSKKQRDSSRSFLMQQCMYSLIVRTVTLSAKL